MTGMLATLLLAAPEVFVILVGGDSQGDRTAYMDRLEMIDDDLLNMEAFFRPLRPKATFVHLVDRTELPFENEIRAATMAALRQTVKRVASDAERTGRQTTVYLYYAGHGRIHVASETSKSQSELFIAPGDGHDGRLRADDFLRELLEPLDEVADVHLIVDACQAGGLINRYGGGVRSGTHPPKRFEPPTEAFQRSFLARHKRTGVLMATEFENTHEARKLGGLFSHALRSGAIGPADIDEDGTISYDELRRFLSVARGKTDPEPTICAPGGELEAPFIRYGELPGISRVHYRPNLISKVRIDLDAPTDSSYATVHLDDRAEAVLYLERGRRFHFRSSIALFDWHERVFSIHAADGPLQTLMEPRSDQQERGQVVVSMLENPINPRNLPTPTKRDHADLKLDSYFGLGVGSSSWSFPAGGFGNLDILWGGSGFFVLGKERWQGRLTLDFLQGGRNQVGSFVHETSFLNGSGTLLYLVNLHPVELGVGGRLGYGRAFMDNLVEKDEGRSYKYEAPVYFAQAVLDLFMPLPFQSLGVHTSLEVGGSHLCTAPTGESCLRSQDFRPVISASLGLDLQSLF